MFSIYSTTTVRVHSAQLMYVQLWCERMTHLSERDVTPTDFAPPPQPLVGLSAKMASIMEGPLSKWTNLMKGWQYRWFVLDYNAGLLSYYTVSMIPTNALH